MTVSVFNQEDKMKYITYSLRILIFMTVIMASTALMVSLTACLIMLVGAR